MNHSNFNENATSVSSDWMHRHCRTLHAPSIEEAFIQAEKQLDDKLAVTEAIHERAAMLLRAALMTMAGSCGFVLKFVDPSSGAFLCLMTSALFLCLCCFATRGVFLAGFYIAKGTHPCQWLREGCIDGNESSYLINKAAITRFIGDAIDHAGNQNRKKKIWLRVAFVFFFAAFCSLAAIYPALWLGR